MSAENWITIAIDAQGGDFGPSVTVPASLATLRADRLLKIILVGRSGEMEPFLAEASTQERERVELLEAEDEIPADARPVTILRKGHESSLWKAMELLAANRADACVSAGNTVALVTLGLKLLGTLRGIRRPALMSNIPSATGSTSVLDLGANLTVDAVQLLQFAIMGSVVRSAEGEEKAPSIGLLNVGHEDSKGHSIVREAHEMLRNTSLNYQGFIEGYDIFEGRVDVAVCDGFSGNLILKSSEGLATMLLGEIRETLSRNWRARLATSLARPEMKSMLERLDPAKHNGAPLLGLNGVVVKSHGRAERFASVQAILEARREARRHVPERIEALISANEVELQQ